MVVSGLRRNIEHGDGGTNNMNMYNKQWLEEVYEKAKKIRYSDFQGKVFFDPNTDKCYTSVEQMKDDYINNMELEDPIPVWGFATKGNRFKLYAEDILQEAYENCEATGDYPDDIVDIEGFKRFIDNWNEKQGFVSYSIDYNTVVLLNV